MSHHVSSAGTSSAAIATQGCSHCCSEDHWIFHYVKFQGLFRKLCTSCVLKLHLSAFCPNCLSLHDPNSLNPFPNPNSNNPNSSSTAIVNNGKIFKCLKCSSVSHSSCVPVNAPKSPYLCTICSNPNFKWFDLKKPRKNDGDDENSNNNYVNNNAKFLDERSAKVLLTAAKIAALSMSKAATQARMEAEKKVREAALAKKRAKEAIDYVTEVSARVGNVNGNGGGGINSNKRREVEVPVSGVVVGSVGLKGGSVVPVRLEKNGGVGVGVGRGNNVGGGNGNPPEIKNVDRSNATVAVAGTVAGPVAGPVTGAVKATPQHMQKKNNGSNVGGGGGKDGTGATGP